MPEKKKTNYVQFELTEREAEAVRDYTKVDALSPSCRSIVLKAVEHLIKK